MPAVYDWAFSTARYTPIDIRDLDGEALLESSALGDDVIGILARLKDRKRAVRQLIDKLLQMHRSETSMYAEALLILAGLRPGLALEVKKC